MGTKQQNTPDAAPAEGSADWQIRSRKEQEHRLAEKNLLLQMVRTGLDYLKLHQNKLEREIAEIRAGRPPTFDGLPPMSGPVANFKPAGTRPPKSGEKWVDRAPRPPEGVPPKPEGA